MLYKSEIGAQPMSVGDHDLGGRNWRFRLDAENLGEHFSQQLDIPWQFDARWMSRGHDDGEWAEIGVPACWQAEGYNYNGAAWYRREFALPGPLPPGGRAWLHFDGVDYFADVWLNERYLGSHEGYFAAFQFDVTPHLLPGQNLLVVRVDSPNDVCNKETQVGQLKNLLKGALQRWDANNPEVNPGGIWNDVRLTITGPGAIADLQVRTRLSHMPHRPGTDEAVPATAIVGVTLACPGCLTGTDEAKLRVELSPVGFEGERAEAVVPVRLAPGTCEWQAPLDLAQARLWHTWDTGTPFLYRATVTLEVDGAVSDRASRTFGFRVLEQGEGWEVRLNGVRLFQRGANYLSDQLLSTMTPDRYEQDVRLLREANLNTVHPFCVVEKQDFYDLCDRYGILVYQDFPMWLTMANTGDLVRRATAQMQELIRQFGHHPSIGIWNCGSQASVANFEKLGSALAQTARELDPTRLVQQSNALVDIGTEGELPADPIGGYHWTEGAVADFQARFDWRVDTHQYRGWYSKDLAAVDSIPRSHLELVTEYGAQALPSAAMLEQFIPAHALFPPAWPYYTRRCFQPEYQFNYIGEPESLDQFIADSQAYQARFIQYHTEHYRRHKFEPCNGAHLFCFNDCWPAITWSVVDYARERKAGFYALQRAMASLQVMLEPEHTLQAGHEVEQALWVVNDYPRAFEGLRVEWKVMEARGEVVASGEVFCRAASNSLDRIGSIRWLPAVAGSYGLHLAVYEGETVIVENQYTVEVRSPGHQ